MSCFRTHWGGLRRKGSAEKPTRSGGSAAKPDEYAVFVFYNIGWQSSLFYELANHAEALHQDLWEALDMKSADVVMLSGCGEVGKGLGERWLTLVRKICGPGFCVVHQGHYTSIVRVHTVEVLEGPSLRGPLSRYHTYRTCQHLRVQWKDSAAEPIDLFNVHSPSSGKHKLTPAVRGEILAWFCQNMGTRAIIGGDLNTSRVTLANAFRNIPDVQYCYEKDHAHGDLVVAKGLPGAFSVACDAHATTDAHRMVVVMLKCATHPPLEDAAAAGSAAESADMSACAAPADASNDRATQAVAQYDARADRDDYPFLSEVERDSSSEEQPDKPAQPAPPSYPLADAMFQALGEHLDAGEAEREFFEHLKESLWTGDWLGPRGGTKKSPQAAKKRLERLLSKATEVRCTYQARLADEGEISDKNFRRSLTEQETTLVHNAWMNDVADWMNEECLHQYVELLKQEPSGKGAGSGASPAHGKVGKHGGKAGGKAGKDEVSAAKPADSCCASACNDSLSNIESTSGKVRVMPSDAGAQGSTSSLGAGCGISSIP